MEDETHLSVIIPAYNEEKRLPKTLAEIDRYLQKQNYKYEVIVVNDGSKDRTAEWAKQFSVKLIDNRENRGKGYVVRQGMLEARGIYRLFTDADNSTSIAEVEKLLPWLYQGYDIAIGSRDLPESVLPFPQPWLRRFVLGQGFKFFRKSVVGLWDIQDTQCGFKAFTEKAAKDIFPRCKIDRWAFDVEILAVANKLGYKIKEVPVVWINDPESKVSFKEGVFKMALEIFEVKLNLIKKAYDISAPGNN